VRNGWSFTPDAGFVVIGFVCAIGAEDARVAVCAMIGTGVETGSGAGDVLAIAVFDFKLCGTVFEVGAVTFCAVCGSECVAGMSDGRVGGAVFAISAGVDGFGKTAMCSCAGAGLTGAGSLFAKAVSFANGDAGVACAVASAGFAAAAGAGD
jgi:hypothetical protein